MSRAARNRRYYLRHKERILSKQKENREGNREACKRYRLENKPRDAARAARYRAAKIQRSPLWADRDAIAEFYLNCPEGYHVDHVVPLRGETVSGLHVLRNLQYLPASDNQRKSNTY